MNTKRLTICAMLIAIYCVLSVLTPIKLLNFKFTFEAFPILIGALAFGPIEGLIVGGIGSFIYQLLLSGYGLTITTILWVLPHAISGLVVGLYAKKHNFKLNNIQTIMICIISALIVTALNSLALYVDSKLFGYYSYVLVFGSILIKIIAGIILAIVYSFTIPRIVSFLAKRSHK